MPGARAHGWAKRRGVAPAVALAFAALAPGLARAGGAARADVSVAAQDSSTASSLFWRQNYRLAFDQAFSDAIRYELRLEFLDDQGVTSVAGLRDTELHTWSVRPVGSIAWIGDDMRGSVTYNRGYRETLDSATDQMRARWMDTLGATAQYQPTSDFHATASFTYDGVSDSSTGTRAASDSGTLGFDWTRGPVRLTEINRITATKDDARGTKRVAYGPAFEALYTQSFGVRASVSTRYHVDYQRAEDSTFRTSGSTALVEVQPVAGVYSVDDYPVDTTTPMSRVPGLVDGNLGVSAGVSLGPDGSSFQNLGIDAGRSQAADEIWVDVRDGSGNAVLSGGEVSWSVYASEDGVRWLAATPATYAFDPSRSLYRIEFSDTVARFFKVVSFGTNTLETYVTEVEVFRNEALASRQTRTSSSLVQGLEAGVTLAPVEKLLLGFQGAVSATANESDGLPTAWALEGTQAYTATAGPFHDVFFDGGHTRMNVGRVAGRGASATQTTTAGTRWQPLPTYDTDLTGLWTDDENATARGRTLALSHGHRLRPYPWLRLDFGANATWQRLESKESPDESSARFLGANALAEIRATRTLELRGDASVVNQLTREETGTTDTLPVSRVVPTTRYGVEGTWRASTQLGVAARWGYLSYAERSGWTQRYRVDWQPLPAGALQLSGSFDTEIDPLTDQSFRRVNATPRLRMNRWSEVGVSYSYVRRSTSDGTTWDQYVYATLSLKL